MHRPSRSAFTAVALVALGLDACATAPRGPAPAPAAELEADVCATTQSFSALIRDKGKERPPSVRLAHAAAWFDMGFAYTTAKRELERCIDPALEATVTTGTEVWEGMPPVAATAKFDKHDIGSFTDKPNDNGWDTQSSLSRIDLETVDVPGGVELRLSVH
ncbi:MAG: hypothetical protein U1F43_25825 [Myxococcota bacterium]